MRDPRKTPLDDAAADEFAASAPPAEHARKSARDRLLDVAGELFYREGVRAIGIDTIIARSGVAKMSLYRNFPSKDDLVVAFLRSRDEWYWTWWDRVMAAHPDDPRRQIEDLFQSLTRRAAHPARRGCPFVNTTSEFPDPEHPVRKVCRANKQKLRDRLQELAIRLGAAEPAALGEQLYLLIQGVYATAAAQDEPSPARHLVAAAAALVAAHLPRHSTSGE